MLFSSLCNCLTFNISCIMPTLSFKVEKVLIVCRIWGNCSSSGIHCNWDLLCINCYSWRLRHWNVVPGRLKKKSWHFLENIQIEMSIWFHGNQESVHIWSWRKRWSCLSSSLGISPVEPSHSWKLGQYLTAPLQRASTAPWTLVSPQYQDACSHIAK